MSKITDEMVEAGAKAMHKHGDEGAWASCDNKDFFRGYAREVLSAALAQEGEAEPVAWVVMEITAWNGRGPQMIITGSTVPPTYEAVTPLYAGPYASNEVIDALTAGKPFVFDPATNFCHADDGGAPEHGIKYVPAPADAGVVESRAATDVIAERKRQVGAEGWTPDHDDEHRDGAIAIAAACYALNTASDEDGPEIRFVGAQLWPWDDAWWKPTERRRDLVKAGALILAEIERLDRAALRTKGGE